MPESKTQGEVKNCVKRQFLKYSIKPANVFDTKYLRVDCQDDYEYELFVGNNPVWWTSNDVKNIAEVNL